METIYSLPTVESLREHVHTVLCKPDQLDLNQTPLFQSLVTRSKKVCGLFFQVQGPRMVKTYAVWAAEENRILFYDSQGIRFSESKLSESPDPATLAPAPAQAPVRKAA